MFYRGLYQNYELEKVKLFLLKLYIFSVFIRGFFISDKIFEYFTDDSIILLILSSLFLIFRSCNGVSIFSIDQIKD